MMKSEAQQARSFDQHGINDMTAAVRREMMGSKGRTPQLNTLFMGGAQPSDHECRALARFALDKNWNIVFPAFDPADPSAGVVDFHAVVTDGLTMAIVMSGGRLWKRDRRSPAVLVFADWASIVRMSSKGRIVVQETNGPRHDHGYELARQSVAGLASTNRVGAAVMAPIGGLTTVMDLKAAAEMFALSS